MKRVSLIVLLIAIVGIGYFAVTKFGGAATAGGVKTTDLVSNTVGQSVVSDLSFTDIDGKSVTVDPNKKTILHFMISTGCSSCAETEISLLKFANNPNVDLVGIAIDPANDTKDTIREFTQYTKSDWPHVIDMDQSLIQKFKVTSIDTVLVVYQNQIIFSGVKPSPSELQKVLK
ncbi:TlpA family protein disulfide reductase [Cohnella phaseoli]|uniref:Cytochrome oxidase Cu insertion factor (SCO1/SenC/PrrC family) n=1 Tax=Cohnella phaseoli TaxID=456490 RepID=A0A3D9JR13_9BACL|nr:redoxin domain-containing protein [Cohnella phaseoli]RED75987.1 cytochrome oxidase Cu insertion factor (SCO1/SenC/PrrC family) [Cohnella phaseoli]